MKIVNSTSAGVVVEVSGRYARLAADLAPYIRAHVESGGDPTRYRSALSRKSQDVDWGEADRFRMETYPRLLNAFQDAKGSPLHLKTTVLDAAHVRKLSAILKYMFSLPAVLVVGAMLFWVVLSQRSGGDETWGALLTIPIVLGSILCHELGHAAALARAGGSPGRVGFGFYYVMPAFFADVTATWALDRRRRLIVDTGGIWLQSAYLVVINVILGIGLELSLSVANGIIVFLMLKTLNPVFKYDGYWMISDLFDVPNLHARVTERVKARSFGGGDGKLIGLYAGLVVAFYGYLSTSLAVNAWHLTEQVQTLSIDDDPLAYLTRVGSLVVTIVFFVWIGCASLRKADAVFRGDRHARD